MTEKQTKKEINKIHKEFLKEEKKKDRLAKQERLARKKEKSGIIS